MKIDLGHFDASVLFLRALRSVLGRSVGKASAADAQRWAQALIASSAAQIVDDFQRKRVELGIVCPACETEAVHTQTPDGPRRSRYVCVKCRHVWAGTRPTQRKGQT